MRLVIDTNQASLIPEGGSSQYSITLSPQVLAEILLRRNPGPTLHRLNTFPLQLGLEVSDVFLELSRLSLHDIVIFEPFPKAGRQYQQDYDRLLEAIYGSPGAMHFTWAAMTKDRNRQTCGLFLAQRPNARTEIKEALRVAHQLSEETKLSNFKDVINNETSRPDSLTKSLITLVLKNNFGLSFPESRVTDISKAALSNQYLRRYFLGWIAYSYSIYAVWKDENMNFPPSPNRDDITDINLLLYAADGDTIVTDDKKLTELVSRVEVDGKVKAMAASAI